jgi:hypothetical protein
VKKYEDQIMLNKLKTVTRLAKELDMQVSYSARNT